MTTSHRVAVATSALAVAAAAIGGCSPDGAAPETSALTVAGYVVPWDERSLAAAGARQLTEVNPVWFQPTESGGVAYASAAAAAAGSQLEPDRLAPSISNFRNGGWDGELVARIVGDELLRTRHVAAIADIVRDGGWRGVDIDYESLPESSRDAYSAFITELAAVLHDNVPPARLSVTLHAKTAEPGDWHGARAQDWAAIGASADEVRLMAYDHSTADSPPGAIAPLSWVDRVLALGVATMPAERISLGLPTYGYDWVDANGGSGGPGGPGGRAVQWADVQAIAGRHDVTPQWDPDTHSPWLSYTDDGGRGHTVWFEDGRTLAAKLDVARRHGIGRVAIWRLGGEDPAVWPALDATR